MQQYTDHQPFKLSHNRNHWQRLFLLTMASAYLYTFMEWLFFVTKPSFMTILNIIEKIELLALTGLILTCLGIFALLITGTVGGCLNRLKVSLIDHIEILIPAIILAGMAFLLLDNFTYIIFSFGIITSQGVWRGIYAVIFLALCVYFYFKILGIMGLLKQKAEHNRFIFAPAFKISMICLLLFSTVSAVTSFDVTPAPNSDGNPGNSPKNARLPNIILIGSDSLNARNMSVYGYERDTTPRLRELAPYSLVAENAFANAGHTSGSIISIFTSKLPTETRVLFAPDILTGVNAYQHLPGILHNRGYLTVEIAVDHFMDSYSLNLLNGFDVVNQRLMAENKVSQFLRKLGYSDAAYFFEQITTRIIDRLLHVFYIRPIKNNFKIVTQPTKSVVQGDQQRIENLLELLADPQEPLFVHVHLMATHGGKYYPLQRTFSGDKVQEKDLMVDFYDDSILDFDHYIGEVIDALKKSGQWDHTMLIIYTDHHQKSLAAERIPLIIHFPGDAYAGSLQSNVQNLDIAPTILDYLGITKPDWMDGISLLDDISQQRRLIFHLKTAHSITNSENLAMLDLEFIKPPFYQFDFIHIIDCHKWHRLNLDNGKWATDDIIGHTAPCRYDELLLFDKIKEATLELLSGQGYDISSLAK